MNCFIEAIFAAPTGRAEASRAADAWRDCSSADYFLFKSQFGAVSLRKRAAYPVTFAKVEGSRLYFGYGSQELGQRLHRTRLNVGQEELFYDEEFLFVVADAGKRTVSVQRDAFSMLPVFVCAQRDRLALSNQFEKVCKLADPAQLSIDTVALAQFLCTVPTYNRTLCKEIKLLYDRARLEWSPKGTAYQLPPNASRLKPDTESDIHELRARIEATIDRLHQRYAAGGQFGCDLSGGMDSSLIAGYLRSQGHDPLTVTMRLAGRQGAEQAQKLQALRQRFAFQNFSLPLDAAKHYPLDFALGEARPPVYHYQLMSYYALDGELLARLAAQNVSCAFTGHGGDELCDNIPVHARDIREDALMLCEQHDQPRWWTPNFGEYVKAAIRQVQQEAPPPVPLVSGSVAGCTARANPDLFNYNVWPVMPLAHPRLYAYCQGLPIRYRHKRNLTRMYLKTKGFPEAIYTGPSGHLGDHYFQAVMQHLEQPLRHYLQRSVLAKCGLLDAQVLLDEFANAKKHTTEETLAISNFSFKVVSVLAAEINLQALGLRP